ncbi:MAG: hypothetical protein H8E34_02370 [Bacteroidetes bacterium]|nr:hypothetical protein [Bacteroidota bacterium]
MIKISKLNRQKRDLICNSLESTSRIGSDIIEKVENKTFNVDVLIYRDFFERFIFCFDSLRLLFKDYNETTFSNDYAITILLRTSLVDFLNVAYLKIHYQEYETKKNSNQNYKTELGKTLCSHLRRTLDRSNKEYLAGNFSEQAYKKTTLALYKDFHFLFDTTKEFNIKDPCNTLIYKNEISNKTIINKIKSQNDIRIRNYGRAIGLFELYSKYEHYGILSRRFQRVDINERFRNIIDSLDILIVGTMYSISFFQNIADIKSEKKLLLDNLNMLERIINLKSK